MCKWYISPCTFADFRLKIFLKKKLVHMVIHVRKIFNCNVLFQIPLSKGLVIVSKKLWTWLDQVVLEWYFRKKYHNSDGSRFHLVALVGSKRKIKMETQNIMVSSYPLKVSSTQNKGVSFSSFGSWSLVLYFHDWVKLKLYLITPAW